MAIAAVVLIFIQAGPAWANIQGGRSRSQSDCCPNGYLDGIRATITPQFFSDDSNNCVIISVHVEDHTNDTLVQPGVGNCGASYSVDGTCGTDTSYNPFRFIETASPDTSYVCHQHGTQNDQTTIWYATRLLTGSTTTWGGYISGDLYESQASFNSTNKFVYAWGELVGGASCSGDWIGDADFAHVQRYNRNGGWTAIGTFPSFGSCWTVTSYSGGAFSVYH
jgi:hypothetical protein